MAADVFDIPDGIDHGCGCPPTFPVIKVVDGYYTGD
jgi:hypothetical protein